jgi:hypothetical protein
MGFGSGVILQLEVEDVHKWQIEDSGNLTTRSTYALCLITTAAQLTDWPGEDSHI